MSSLDAEMWAWYALTLVVVVARMASRRMLLGSFKRMLADDYLMAVTMITYTALLAIVSVLTRTPTNLINPDDHIVLTPEDIKLREYGSKLVLVTEHMQMITLWGVKGCLLFMYGRLTMSLKQNFLVKLVAGYVIVGFVVMQILWFAAWCRPFNHYWQVPPDDLNCSAETNHMITNAVVNISSDIMIILLPMPVFLQSQLPLKRKIILCGVFALGIFTILAATMSKIYSLGDPFGTEWSYWYIREVSTAVIAANLPLTWTLLQRVFRLGSFHAKYGKSSNQRTGEGTSRFRSAYGNLSSMDRRPKKTTFVEPGMSFSESQEEINGKDIPLKIYQKNEVIVNVTTEEASSDKRSPSPPGHTGLERINLREANAHGGTMKNMLRILSAFHHVAMDARESPQIEIQISPEQIPSTGLSVVYEPGDDATIVDVILVHGLKGHPYKTWRYKQGSENAEKKPKNQERKTSKLDNPKRLELRQSFKALLKRPSSKGRQDSVLTTSTVQTSPAAPENDLSVFWPADLLPITCRKARILTFGYDTKITKFTSGPTNMNSIYSHGKDFLFSLGRNPIPGRPLIFVAHSLGGLLVKEMLALSSISEKPEHKKIVESTAAIVFLGTPHRGSPKLAAIGDWARSMVSSLRFQTTSTILDTLGLKTTDLERTHEAFCRLWNTYDFQVKTFQESLGLTGIGLGVLGDKVVPHESSLIGDPREHAETLQANHNQLSRFSSAHDPNYIKVAGEIKALYNAIESAHDQNKPSQKSAPGIRHQTVKSVPLMSDVCQPLSETSLLDFLDRKILNDFLSSLRFEDMNARRDSILPPSLNTGSWLTKNEDFEKWQTTSDKNQHLLFVKGKPGAGKSTLMKETVRRMQQSLILHKDRVCASFFINAGGQLLHRSPAGIYRSLLYQILPETSICNPSASRGLDQQALIQTIQESVLQSGKIRNEQQLQTLLTQTLRLMSSTGTPIFVFLDALDELGEVTQSHQVDFWSELVQSPDLQTLRVCLSCRHFPNISVTGCLELKADEYNRQDIFNYTQRRLKARIASDEAIWIKEIASRIYSLSEGVFLWVVLVIEDVLKRYNLGIGLQMLLYKVESMPSELDGLYSEICGSLTRKEVPVARKMFQWVLAASRPLRLDEWHHIIAFIRPLKPSSLTHWRNSGNYTATDDHLVRQIKRLSMGLLEVSSERPNIKPGGIAEVSSVNAGAGSMDHEQGSARVVRVIHESVYDFFINKGGFQKLCLETADPLLDCHYTIIHTCLDYLFIPELDEFVAARQRLNSASVSTSSFHSFPSEEPRRSSPVPQDLSVRYEFKNLRKLPTLDSNRRVENWLAEHGLLPSDGSIVGSRRYSVTHESIGIASRVLVHYPALLLYIMADFQYHIEFLSTSGAFGSPTWYELLSRLRDKEVSDRLMALQRENHRRDRTAEFLRGLPEHGPQLAQRSKPLSTQSLGNPRESGGRDWTVEFLKSLPEKEWPPLEASRTKNNASGHGHTQLKGLGDLEVLRAFAPRVATVIVAAATAMKVMGRFD
ncbi:hypothetical protein CEK27_011447 [Fusarium fujikuroi]|uniref:Orc1-like AAA ATPase domain-containing protein n=1 Tax=Fusarium fujikuroi TaxID=5127 RepID=A0A9Q9RVZ0_FUSFU|nr:hypothetical protein CEK27_011447 [Fusarium fujikuroi]VTT78493.1 unnamed protein product [Fusarium fujikuroi]